MFSALGAHQSGIRKLASRFESAEEDGSVVHRSFLKGSKHGIALGI